MKRMNEMNKNKIKEKKIYVVHLSLYTQRICTL